MIDSLKVIPNKLYWELIGNLVRKNGGMSEYIIVQKRIANLRVIIKHYKTTSQIIPIEWIIELNHLEQVGMNFCKTEENKIEFEYSNN